MKIILKGKYLYKLENELSDEIVWLDNLILTKLSQHLLKFFEIFIVMMDKNFTMHGLRLLESALLNFVLKEKKSSIFRQFLYIQLYKLLKIHHLFYRNNKMHIFLNKILKLNNM